MRENDEWGTIRVIVGQAEIDLESINQEFKYMYGAPQSIARHVEKIQTKKEEYEYRDTLLALLGKK